MRGKTEICYVELSLSYAELPKIKDRRKVESNVEEIYYVILLMQDQ